VKLLRTIALDPSDTFVFDAAAEPGDWAVSGAFRFWDVDPEGLTGKARVAFRSGFLGVQSWGWSTLVQIVEASEDEHREAVERLAQQLVAHFGAPDLASARRAAEEEVDFAAALCTHAADTLVAVHRTCANGEIHEAFRTLQRREGDDNCGHRAFTIVEVTDEASADDSLALQDLLTERTTR